MNSASTRSELKAGVLALQGDVREHLAALAAVGVQAVAVRRASELEDLDGLILPGGESTAMDRLIRAFGLAEPLKKFIASGRAVYGSCAGMILLADRLAEPAVDLAGQPQRTLGGLPVTVRRNAFGRQRESFETELEFAELSEPERPVHAVFIRAPWVEATSSGVTVLATVRIEGIDRAVAVRSGNILATSFHPEVLTQEGNHAELRVHELFAGMMRQNREVLPGAEVSRKV
ncbi:pyridoxal 5'-phosphate synthase glutaminase subunit PdxT [Arthrobacter russicus]|uniref:Pyridoxal 5'-phosphate synthase subunit PdxT n=1 Tax=Arthrobacter russicus TaxID=172040 RepID=A0ABU1J6T5_9MICC|nr:pyridoxal 5'-phosphate synthase glutaminase subunit PdxT [Arthrobacter russicus]MDR6267869.1 5'-phosphate synthase pdxT subunit [Arthrobacter russicus]